MILSFLNSTPFQTGSYYFFSPGEAGFSNHASLRAGQECPAYPSKNVHLAQSLYGRG